VQAPTVLFETCNLACRADEFRAAGGFPVLDLLGPEGRGFGEDVVLGAELARRWGRHWVPEAMVHHRWLPGTFRDHLVGRRRLRAFPVLLQWVPELGEGAPLGAFLSRKTAAYDVALAAALTAVVTRRVWPAAGVLPWLRLQWPHASAIGRRHAPQRYALLAVGDLVGLASLVEGSVRSRRLLL
jgi:hypothetical protein